MLSLHKIHPLLSVCVYIGFIISSAFVLKLLYYPSYLDFGYYYHAIQSFAHGGDPYALRAFPFLYPPAAILLILPFTAIPLFIAGPIFVTLLVLCFLLSIVLIFRLFHISVTSLSGLFIASLAFNFFPMKYSIASGQINTVVLLLITLFVYWYIRNRFYLAGWVLACAIALKLFPILIIPYLIIDRQWKIIVSMLIALFVFAIAVLLIVPFNVLSTYFFTTLPILLLHSGAGTNYYDQSLSAFIARTLLYPFSAQIARVVASLLIIATLYLLWSFRNRSNARLLSISILLILSTILNNFVWQHHFVWLLVPFFLTLSHIRIQHTKVRYYIILAISFFLVAYNLKTPSSVPVPLQSHVLYGTLILFVLNVYFLIFTSGRNKDHTAHFRISGNRTNPPTTSQELTPRHNRNRTIRHCLGMHRS